MITFLIRVKCVWQKAFLVLKNNVCSIKPTIAKRKHTTHFHFQSFIETTSASRVKNLLINNSTKNKITEVETGRFLDVHMPGFSVRYSHWDRAVWRDGKKMKCFSEPTGILGIGTVGYNESFELRMLQFLTSCVYI